MSYGTYNTNSMKRILVVDDSQTILLFIQRVLSKGGYKVDCTDKGSVAVPTYEATRADLVILDVVMQGMDGLETLQALQKVDPQVKILAISGLGTLFPPLYLNMMLKLGAKGILEKPFSDAALREAVEQLIGPADNLQSHEAA